MVVVTVENGSWLLPPQRALWVPSWFDHESVARKSGALKTLPLNGDDSIVLPRTVQLLTMSSFFRAVLIEALREEHATADTTRAHCLRRTEERRVGQECGSKERSRGSPNH